MTTPEAAGGGTEERIGPVTPGSVLLEEFMRPLGLSARRVARDLGVAPNRITEIINGERAVTAETAILLERRFGASAKFWLGLQASHDLEKAGYVRAIPVSGEEKA